MDEIQKFLTEKVLLSSTDTLSADIERRLQGIRREKVDKPVIYVSSGTSSIIAGSIKTAGAVQVYNEDAGIGAAIVKVGCSNPINFEPVIGVHIPGKNKLIFRNITEEKVDHLLNSVFHNDIPEEDLVGQSGTKGFETWHGIPFVDDLPWFAHAEQAYSRKLWLLRP